VNVLTRPDVCLWIVLQRWDNLQFVVVNSVKRHFWVSKKLLTSLSLGDLGWSPSSQNTNGNVALIILLAISLLDSRWRLPGAADPLGVHGAIVLLAGIAGTFGVISGYYAPEPDNSRLDRYFDDPSRMG